MPSFEYFPYTSMGSFKMTWSLFMSKSTKVSVQIIRAEDNTDNVWGNWKWSKEISTSISESFTMRHIIHLDTRLDNISIIISNLVLTWLLDMTSEKWNCIWSPWWLVDWMFKHVFPVEDLWIWLWYFYGYFISVIC